MEEGPHRGGNYTGGRDSEQNLSARQCELLNSGIDANPQAGSDRNRRQRHSQTQHCPKNRQDRARPDALDGSFHCSAAKYEYRHIKRQYQQRDQHSAAFKPTVSAAPIAPSRLSTAVPSNKLRTSVAMASVGRFSISANTGDAKASKRPVMSQCAVSKTALTCKEAVATAVAAPGCHRQNHCETPRRR